MKIENCQFIGAKYDEKSMESVVMVAEALLNLSKLFVAQQVEIECLLKVEPDQEED